MQAQVVISLIMKWTTLFALVIRLMKISRVNKMLGRIRKKVIRRKRRRILGVEMSRKMNSSSRIILVLHNRRKKRKSAW